MDERIDILDTEGNYTGQRMLKSQAHREGLFHATVHVWFYTSDAQILIQQRGKDKTTYPLLWDVSVAGHVSTKETIETSAIREVQEEIGLEISRKDIDKIGVFKSVQKHGEHLTDCEFHHVFLSLLKVPLEKLKKQTQEVENLKLQTLDCFLTNIDQGSKQYVPHTKEYYETVISAIKKKL